jgi:hypothetical protein
MGKFDILIIGGGLGLTYAARTTECKNFVRLIQYIAKE